MSGKSLLTFSLSNQHAMCGVEARGATRRKAFDNAFRLAWPEFRHYGFAEAYGSPAGADVAWLACFLDGLAYMRRGAMAGTYTNEKHMVVLIERV
jgi:hypothetical protein